MNIENDTTLSIEVLKDALKSADAKKQIQVGGGFFNAIKMRQFLKLLSKKDNKVHWQFNHDQKIITINYANGRIQFYQQKGKL